MVLLRFPRHPGKFGGARPHSHPYMPPLTQNPVSAPDLVSYTVLFRTKPAMIKMQQVRVVWQGPLAERQHVFGRSYGKGSPEVPAACDHFILGGTPSANSM